MFAKIVWMGNGRAPGGGAMLAFARGHVPHAMPLLLSLLGFGGRRGGSPTWGSGRWGVSRLVMNRALLETSRVPDGAVRPLGASGTKCVPVPASAPAPRSFLFESAWSAGMAEGMSYRGRHGG